MSKRPINPDETKKILAMTDDEKQITPFPNEVSPENAFTEISVIAAIVAQELKINENKSD